MIPPKHKNVRERHSCFMSVLLSKYLFEFVDVSYLVCIYLFSAKQVDEKNLILLWFYYLLCGLQDTVRYTVQCAFHICFFVVLFSSPFKVV